MAGVAREVFEETGLCIADLRLVGLYYGMNDGLLRVVFTAIAGGDGPLRPRRRGEIVDARWFERTELPRPMPKLAVRMIDDALTNETAVLAEISDDRELIEP